MKSFRRLFGACALIEASIVWTASSAGAATPGLSIDFGSQRGSVEAGRAWQGRAWIHPTILSRPYQPSPVIVFMHGLNREHLPFRWLGPTIDPDLRQIVSSLIDGERVEPAVIVAPTTTTDGSEPRRSWAGFDLKRFLTTAEQAVAGKAMLDRSRIILVGHSGAGCNPSGGILAAIGSGVHLLAVLMIDTCMDLRTAPGFARAAPETDVVVAWQPLGWNRPFFDFQHSFLQIARAARPSGLRIVQRFDIREPRPHTAIVGLALERWLPHWLPPAQNSGFPGAATSTPKPVLDP